MAGRWAWMCRENGQLRADGAAHLDRLLGLLVGHWRKPVGDVLDRIHAISYLSRWPEGEVHWLRYRAISVPKFALRS